MESNYFKDDIEYNDFLTIRFLRNLRFKKCITFVELLKV